MKSPAAGTVSVALTKESELCSLPWMSLPAQLDPRGADHSCKCTSALCSLMSYLTAPDTGTASLTQQDPTPDPEQISQNRSRSPALWPKHLIAQGLLWWTECPKYINSTHTALQLGVLESPSTSKKTDVHSPLGYKQPPLVPSRMGTFEFANFVFILKVLLIPGLDPNSFVRSKQNRQNKDFTKLYYLNYSRTRQLVLGYTRDRKEDQ